MLTFLPSRPSIIDGAVMGLTSLLFKVSRIEKRDSSAWSTLQDPWLQVLDYITVGWQELDLTVGWLELDLTVGWLEPFTTVG
jgi:hypothetical protein